ncbi:MAG: CHC2 zinc finger domain-containing protein [Limisphaerales bacterium]
MKVDFEQVKRTTDIVQVVASYGIALKKVGQDQVGLCPFHDDHHPSLRVTPGKGLFRCPSCKATGNVIQFVARKEGISEREAGLKLQAWPGRNAPDGAKKPAAGVPVNGKSNGAQPLLEERAQVLLERALAIYQKHFADAPEGRAYLAGRGIAEASQWERHGVGYCNGKLPELLPNDERVRGELKTLGLLLPDGRERFAGCVVFPIRDAEGRLTTLYGRQAGPAPNAPDGAKANRHFFLPGRPTGLWNAAALKTHAHVVLVESVIDGLSVELAGSANVVAVQGTNGLSAADVQTLRDYGVQRVTLLLDGDKAGREATEKMKASLSFFSCQVLSLPEGEDPNSYLQKHGAKKLAAFLSAETKPTTTTAATAPGVTVLPGGFAVQFGLRHYEVRGLESGPRKLKATVRVEHAGRLHVDTLDFYSARWRRQLAQDLTRIFDDAAEVIEADIAKLMSLCEASQAGAGLNAIAPPVETMPPEQRAEAEALGKSPDLIQLILDDYDRCGLVGERANKLLCYLAMTSRKMEKPLAVLILSSSGAGKTMLQDTAMQFCPPEDLVKLTSLSGKALFYKEGSSLKNKVLALEEGDGVEEAMYALRNLISAGELMSESTIKDPASGRLTTMENRVEGPTAVFLTTTKPDSDPETKSRFFITSVDESRAQTQAILASQRRRQTLAGLTDRLAVEPVLRKHRNFQRLLQPLPVVNRYADQLSYADDRLQGRRDQPKYLNLINAVALLRQMQKQARPVRNGEAGTVAYIEVDKEDIRLANELATEILGHSLDELSRPATDLLQLLVKMQTKPAKDTAKEKNPGRRPPTTDEAQWVQAAPAFTRRQIREFTGWSNARVHRYLQELIELEFVLMEHGRNGVLHRYRLAYDGQGEDGGKFLLGLKPVNELRN